MFFLILFAILSISQQQEVITHWLQWVLSYPKEQVDLLLDSTGEGIMKYQPHNEKYYFLTGGHNASQIRNVTIHANKGILVPVLNGIQSCFNCNLIQMAIGNVEQKIKDQEQVNLATHLEAKLDGKNIPMIRVTTPLIDMTYTKNNAFDIPREGTYPTVSDGYWVFTEPLSKGKHTLYIRGEDPQYHTEVKYYLNVS
jgi:hypothetical protein